MNCRKCNYPLNEGAKYCPNCGVSMSSGLERRRERRANRPQQELTQQFYSKYNYVLGIIITIILLMFFVNGLITTSKIVSYMDLHSSSLSSEVLGLYTKLLGLIKVENIFILISSLGTLALAIISSMLKRSEKIYRIPYINLVRAQFYISLIAVSFAAIHLIFEFAANRIISTTAWQINWQLINGYRGGMIGVALIFLTLLIPCISKSLKLLKKS